MVWGKEVRINRITENGKMVCVPFDHGLTQGPIKGLERIDDIIEKIQRGGATAILLHKGIIRTLKNVPRIGLIVHLSGSTELGLNPNKKVRVGTIEEAIRLGADAVSVHVNMGNNEELEMIHDLGMISDECHKFGIPLLAMMYPRGEKIKDPNDTSVIAHAARAGAELGADFVKTVYTGSKQSFKDVVDSCPVPVVIAGGPKQKNDIDLLKMIHGSKEAGAKGVALGRNVFQHEDPEAIVRAISLIVKKGKSVQEALEVLRQ